MSDLKKTERFIVSGISLPIKASRDNAFGKAEKALLKFFSGDEILSYNISRRSVDARKKSDIRFVYSVSADVRSTKLYDVVALAADKITKVADSSIEAKHGTEKLCGRPVVVGFGPGGMFCAYILAKYGYRPIVIERGSDIKKRMADVARFKNEQILDPESNIQFGAGGAGTFSDGKLMTRINDNLCSFVIETFHKLGSPENILYEAKPHIGTDYLVGVVDNMLKELISLGADVYFDTKMNGICESLGKVNKIRTSSGEIECGALVLALGHSARDTVTKLRNDNLWVIPKAFSVGVRIEHLQENIDFAMYGKSAYDGILPHAEYALSTHVGGRGVYTFCMCPGGYVMAAASEEGGVVTNGMSNAARDSDSANSALLVDVRPEDFSAVSLRPESPLAGIDFQMKYEKLAWENRTHSGMAKTNWGSFRDNTEDSLRKSLPAFAWESICEAMPFLGRKLEGFDREDALLTGVETRSSSPLRVVRDENMETSVRGVIPAGEGPGYAGGIMSAAVEGIKAAEAVIRRHLR